MPTTQIVLIRHGETAWNAERRLQGHIDIALNQEGLRQAALLARALGREHFDAIVSSDLQRAAQTADALARVSGMPVRRDPQLRERCYGAFEGLLYTEIAQRFPAEFAAWQARDIDARMPAGARVAEPFRQFYARSIAAIQAWGAAHPGQKLALVAHGGVLECAYRAALGKPLDSPRDFEIKNASVNRLLYAGGKLSLRDWGDVRHLDESAMDELM